MLNPLAMMIVLTIVFSQLFKAVEGYPAYILSGLVAWTFFAQTTTASINSLVWGGDFFQRIYVPRSIFAISAMGTGIVNLFLSLIPLLGVMVIVSVPIQPTIIFMPIPILFLACFALGIGLLVSSIAIYFPDVVEMYQIVLMIWFYITPIIYPMEIIPEQIQPLLRLNPLFPLITLFRLPIYDGKIPTLADLLPAFLIAFITLGVGWWVFTRKSDEFAYRT
jgi:ABC-2 type transport system permease protein